MRRTVLGRQMSLSWGRADSGCGQLVTNPKPQSSPQTPPAGQLFPALRFPGPCCHPPSSTG